MLCTTYIKQYARQGRVLRYMKLINDGIDQYESIAELSSFAEKTNDMTTYVRLADMLSQLKISFPSTTPWLETCKIDYFNKMKSAVDKYAAALTDSEKLSILKQMGTINHSYGDHGKALKNWLACLEFCKSPAQHYEIYTAIIRSNLYLERFHCRQPRGAYEFHSK